MLRTYVYERIYVLPNYDPRLKYPFCYDPLVYQITERGYISSLILKTLLIQIQKPVVKQICANKLLGSNIAGNILLGL